MPETNPDHCPACPARARGVPCVARTRPCARYCQLVDPVHVDFAPAYRDLVLRSSLEAAGLDPGPPARDDGVPAPPPAARPGPGRLDVNDLRFLPGGPPTTTDLYRADGTPLGLRDHLRGASAFLVACGPSLADLDLSLLSRRGAVVLAVNQAAALVRPHIFVHVDRPDSFPDAVWLDPGILKVSPLGWSRTRLRSRDSGGAFTELAVTPADCPNVAHYARNERFRAAEFLDEPTFNWGNHRDEVDELGHASARSVLSPALKLLWFLGVTRVYLLGVDFRMDAARPYASGQAKGEAGVAANNRNYAVFAARLGLLAPELAARGVEVRNCSPGSALDVFPREGFAEAIAEATEDDPPDPAGWYL
jgi:hypothetical protein